MPAYWAAEIVTAAAAAAAETLHNNVKRCSRDIDKQQSDSNKDEERTALRYWMTKTIDQQTADGWDTGTAVVSSDNDRDDIDPVVRHCSVPPGKDI